MAIRPLWPQSWLLNLSWVELTLGIADAVRVYLRKLATQTLVQLKAYYSWLFSAARQNDSSGKAYNHKGNCLGQLFNTSFAFFFCSALRSLYSPLAHCRHLANHGKIIRHNTLINSLFFQNYDYKCTTAFLWFTVYKLHVRLCRRSTCVDLLVDQLCDSVRHMRPFMIL